MNAIIPILIIAFFATIIFLIYYFSSKKIIVRTLRKTPLRSISKLREGEFCKIQGKALHVDEPLIAPFSKRKCIGYHMKIEQLRSSGKSRHWKTIVEKEVLQPFFVNENGDYAIIKPVQNPRNYIGYLVHDRNTKSGTFNDPKPEFKALLEHYGVDSENFLGFNKSLRYSEGIIEIGERITVAGKTTYKTLSEPIPEYPYSTIAALEENGKQKLIITDIDFQEITKDKL